MKIFIFLVLILSMIVLKNGYAVEQHAYSFTSIQEEKRFDNLIKEIRCVVCQNQSIAESNAPMAMDLREKIYHMVNTQQSNEEIKNFLVKRYGEFILLQPQFNKKTWVLWLFPVCLLGGVLLVLGYVFFSSGTRGVF
ncbi:MAG TPA: cytochrome c-type biogenesis protein [Gammaproteobacteria bacterium]|jgi:cytochrome c-type biogenesis protein CcmH|nr:cytochrome c-type biogenesis protein [Gammaproteobacteria bacterium]